MSYYIEPVLWEDEKFSELSFLGRLVWIYLLTGRCRTILPGLVVTQAQTIAGKIPPASVQEIEAELEDLVTRRMIEMDRHLVRVVNAPKYARCLNPSILRGWYRIWHDLPPSTLKYAHLGPLHRHCIVRAHASVQAAWTELFVPELQRWEEQGNTVPTVPTVNTVPTMSKVSTVKTVSASASQRNRNDIDIDNEIEVSTVHTVHTVSPSQAKSTNLSIDHLNSQKDPEFHSELDEAYWKPGMTVGEWRAACRQARANGATPTKEDPCKH